VDVSNIASAGGTSQTSAGDPSNPANSPTLTISPTRAFMILFGSSSSSSSTKDIGCMAHGNSPSDWYCHGTLGVVPLARPFADQLRTAREAALKDAEAFDGIIHAIERLGSFLMGSTLDLGKYKDHLSKIVRSGRRSFQPLSFRADAILSTLRYSAGSP
jgi:hypothetical protein